MHDFATSKGFQEVLMSEETYGLLIAEYNADLSVRGNFYPLGPHVPYAHADSKVILMPNFHMLGSVQVLVETPGGQRLGYSGDFAWPLDEKYQMRCDALVVDATYGSPESTRQYTQEEAEGSFLELAFAKLKRGPLHVKAFRGTIQRALQLLSGEIDAPVICSEHLCREISVYQRFGSAVGTVVSSTSAFG